MIARIVIVMLSGAWMPAVAAPTCGTAPVQVQVLGSGGPELADKRASSSYLVWIGGKPRVLGDIGGGGGGAGGVWDGRGGLAADPDEVAARGELVRQFRAARA